MGHLLLLFSHFREPQLTISWLLWFVNCFVSFSSFPKVKYKIRKATSLAMQRRNCVRCASLDASNHSLSCTGDQYISMWKFSLLHSSEVSFVSTGEEGCKDSAVSMLLSEKKSFSTNPANFWKISEEASAIVKRLLSKTMVFSRPSSIVRKLLEANTEVEFLKRLQKWFCVQRLDDFSRLASSDSQRGLYQRNLSVEIWRMLYFYRSDGPSLPKAIQQGVSLSSLRVTNYHQLLLWDEEPFLCVFSLFLVTRGK